MYKFKEENKFKLKKEVTFLLLAGDKITFDFNCGNDEGLIDTYYNGESTYVLGNLDFSQYLEELIFTTLDLPSVGEYCVDGTGSLFLKNNNIYLKYNLEGYHDEYPEDFDDENDDEPIRVVENKMDNDAYLLLDSSYDNVPENMNIENYIPYNYSSANTSSVFTLNEKLINSDVNKNKPWWKFW